MKKKNILLLFAVLLLSCSAGISYGQLSGHGAGNTSSEESYEADEPDPTDPPDGEDPLDTPIDGGLSLLIAAGIGIGAKKIHAARKRK